MGRRRRGLALGLSRSLQNKTHLSFLLFGQDCSDTSGKGGIQGCRCCQTYRCVAGSRACHRDIAGRSCIGGARHRGSAGQRRSCRCAGQQCGFCHCRFGRDADHHGHDQTGSCDGLKPGTPFDDLVPETAAHSYVSAQDRTEFGGRQMMHTKSISSRILNIAFWCHHS